MSTCKECKFLGTKETQNDVLFGNFFSPGKTKYRYCLKQSAWVANWFRFQCFEAAQAELKPCIDKNCGGTSVVLYSFPHHSRCKTCDMDGPKRDTESEAIEAHNEISNAVHGATK